MKHVLVENELNELSQKFKLVLTKDYSFILVRMYRTGVDGFQNMFVYQPTSNTTKHKNKSIGYVTGWKSKEVYTSKLNVLNSDFLLNIKYFLLKE